MNIKQLTCFCKVVETGNASQAAKELNLFPAALSVQLTSLEQELQAVLLDRSSRPMTLTAFGRFFYPRAVELVNEFQRLETDAGHFNLLQSTTLTVAFTRSVMFNLLPQALKALTGEQKELVIHLKEVITEQQDSLILKNEVDIGITRELEHTASDSLHYELILADPLMAVVPKDHELTQKSALTLSEFCAFPFISYPSDQRFTTKLFEQFAAYQCVPQIAHHVNEIHTALALVGAGLGVTMVGKTLITNMRMDVTMLPIRDFNASSYIHAVRHRKNRHPSVLRLIELLKKTAECHGIV
jgi:DNA-binding transcriptional LysR family regulator